MGRVNSYLVWINVGYELFSEEGPEGIQIERLSRISGFNKSGFYHYFGDRYGFFDHLLAHHFKNAESFVGKVRILQDFNPSFIQLLVDFKTTVFFDMQLNKSRDWEIFNKAYHETSKLVAEAVLQIWSLYLQLPEGISREYWEYMRDSFFARITLKKYDFEFILGLTDQFRHTVGLSIDLASFRG